MSAALKSSHATLAAAIADAAGITSISAPALASIRRKFSEHAFNLLVAGEFKRGKSTLINALLGADLLPTSVVPLTSVVTLLHYADVASAHVAFESGDIRDVPLEALAEYVTERGNPDNIKHVREVVVAFPATWLKGGIRLVDTPGVGSVHSHNSEVTSRYLPEADAVIFMVSADQPLSRNELDFLIDIRRYAGKVFCLLNKVDYLSETEREESMAFAVGVLRDAITADVPVFAVSARRALLARSKGDVQQWADSGLAQFEQALQRFLQEEGGDIWLESVRRQLLRLLVESRLSLELEQQALSLPLATLDAHLLAFAQKQQQTLQAQSDLDALLEADAHQLLSQHIEPDLGAFAQALLIRIHTALPVWYEELRVDGAAALQAGLESQLTDEIRKAFDSWRADENVVANQIFERVCQRFWHGMHDLVDELLRYSAELFAVPFTAIAAESLWRASSGFYYKFWEEPPSLQLLGRSLVRLLPGSLGHPLILRHAHQRADELVDMQSGRLRHDFDERIKKSMQDFRREMHERIEVTISGIEAAIGKGRDARISSEGNVAAQLQAVTLALDGVKALEARLGSGATETEAPSGLHFSGSDSDGVVR
jgi:GTP-binding protein EngB required for normal cell division